HRPRAQLRLRRGLRRLLSERAARRPPSHRSPPGNAASANLRRPASVAGRARAGCKGMQRGGNSVTGHSGWRLRSLATAVAVVAALVPFSQAARAQQLAPPAGTADTWFFAEGNTLPNWFEFIVIINPDPANDISVHVDYQLEEPA